ncbi:MAG: AAA family ATPase [bacterium]|nr:AAA family ATPase [bacterium]
MADDALIKALRAALSATPENAVLRKHLAEHLFAAGAYAEAEQEYRRAVEQDASQADADFEAELHEHLPPPAAPDEQAEGILVEGWPVPAAPTDGRMERPNIAFKDVGGMDKLKEEIRIKIIHPVQHPEIYKAYGKKAGGGILMYGPPGCGKTYLARATAGEIRASFISIGIHDVLNMWIGQSERNLHQLFELARRTAPCVIFIDEVDALGADRTDMKHSAARTTINQLLVELDGVNVSNDGVLILAATNAPWHIDPALRRPGRFDQILFVPPPDAPARAEILRVMLRDKPAEQTDIDQLAKKTGGFSGADLKAVVERAIEEKLRDALKTGIPAPLTTADLLRSVGTVKPSTREWFATARNYALYANESGTYDDVLAYMKKHENPGLFSSLFGRDTS